MERRAARVFWVLFLVLLVWDAVLFVVHAVLMDRGRRDHDADLLLELAIACAHFGLNSIALVDLFGHLGNFIASPECEFKPAKTANAFVFSIVCLYTDVAGKLLADQHHRDNPLFDSLLIVLIVQSGVTVVVSVACFAWGSRNNVKCKLDAAVPELPRGQAAAHGMFLKLT